MSALKARALALATKDVPRPSRGELLMRRCEELVDVIHEARGLSDLSDSWTDVAGYLNNVCSEDLAWVRRTRGES